MPKLPELFHLTGTVVTADAMHCQRQLAQQVAEQSGDYVLALKANQGTLNDDVRLLLDDPSTPQVESSQTSKGHGRVETCTARVSDKVDCPQETHQWPGLEAVGKVAAWRYQYGQISTENHYHCCARPFRRTVQ